MQPILKERCKLNLSELHMISKKIFPLQIQLNNILKLQIKSNPRNKLKCLHH